MTEALFPLSGLPFGLIYKIADCLDPDSLSALARTCKLFRDIAYTPHFQLSCLANEGQLREGQIFNLPSALQLSVLNPPGNVVLPRAPREEQTPLRHFLPERHYLALRDNYNELLDRHLVTGTWQSFLRQCSEEQCCLVSSIDIPDRFSGKDLGELDGFCKTIQTLCLPSHSLLSKDFLEALALLPPLAIELFANMSRHNCLLELLADCSNIFELRVYCPGTPVMDLEMDRLPHSLPNLKSLMLCGHAFTAATVAPLIRRCPNLEILNCSYCKNLTIAGLFNHVTLRQLTILNLSGTQSGNAGLQMLPLAAPAIEELDICYTTNIGAGAFPKDFFLPRLITLACAGTGINSSDLNNLLHAHPRLEKLVIRSCDGLAPGGFDNMPQMPNLKFADLYGLNITDNDLQHFIESVPALEYLNISRCKNLTAGFFEKTTRPQALQTLVANSLPVARALVDRWKRSLPK